MPHPLPFLRLVTLLALLSSAVPLLRAAELGLFTDHTDIGAVKKTGTVAYDAAKDSYTIGGGGANMWFASDEFHFAWKKVSGDTALAATIEFTGRGTNAHRKAVLMIRQSLETDSAYVDAALHADGLTSLQFRETAGGNTAEIQAPLSAPRRLLLEKIGDWAYLSAGPATGPLKPTGASILLPFSGDLYVGIGVCAHAADEFETIAFTDVKISQPTVAASPAAALRSIVEIKPNPSGDRRALHATTEIIDTLTWPRDDSLFFLSNGRLNHLSLTTLPDGKLVPAGPPSPSRDVQDFSAKAAAAGDHQPVLSPDGKWIAYLRYQPPTP